MSEEVKDQQENQEPAAEEKKEVAQEASGAEQPSTAKVKKVNRMSMNQLNAKIAEMETKKLNTSIYFKHLVQRKSELEGYPVTAGAAPETPTQA